MTEATPETSAGAGPDVPGDELDLSAPDVAAEVARLADLPDAPWNAADQDPEPAAEDAEGTNPNREAARYRTRLREVEAERDAITSRLNVYEKAHVERLAAERLAVPGDFFLVGPQLDELRGEDGAIDEEKVRSAVVSVLAERPTWDLNRRARLPQPNMHQGSAGTAPKPGGAEAFAHLVSGG
jgi:hypothetical protein